MPEVQKRDDVEDQAYEGDHKECEGGKPCEHECAVASAGRRRGNTDNVVESPEKLRQHFDHRCVRSVGCSLTRFLFPGVDEQAKSQPQLFYRACDAASSMRAAT